MRVCPAGNGKGACACGFHRFLTSGLGRRSKRYIGAASGPAERRSSAEGARVVNNPEP